jgi:protein-disulfide isomerase
VAIADVRVRVASDAESGAPFHAFDMGRRTVVLGSLAIAAVTAGALVAVFSLGSGSAASPAATLSGVAQVASMLRGVPQDGSTLGSPNAPVTLMEFADLQCPYCGMWERDALPAIVARYVRPGKVRVEFTGMAFVGADSETALRTALAAAGQNRFWNVLALLYENQGVENTGWVTDSLLRTIGGAVPGLDTERMLADRTSTGVDSALAAASSLAQRMGVNSTPSFWVGPTGGRLSRVSVPSLDAAGIEPALDAALAQ